MTRDTMPTHMTLQAQIPAPILELARSVARIVREELGIQTRVWLFGSWAKGTAAPRSDLDVAFEANADVDPRARLRIDDRLEALPTLRKIDLVNLEQVGEPFRTRVLSAGLPL